MYQIVFSSSNNTPHESIKVVVTIARGEANRLGCHSSSCTVRTTRDVQQRAKNTVQNRRLPLLFHANRNFINSLCRCNYTIEMAVPSKYMEFELVGDRYEVPIIKREIFDDIVKLFERAKLYKRETAEAKKDVEKLDEALNKASEVLTQAEEKKEALIKRNRFLEGKLLEREKNIQAAVDYWRDYGLDVKQVHQKGDPYEQYEFIFTNLNRRRKNKKSIGSLEPAAQTSNPQQSDQGDQPQASENTASTPQQQRALCSVFLRYQDKKLELVGQDPDILSTESLTLLNEKLTHHCVNQTDGHVNWRSAMTLIRKDLMKGSPSSKTCSHPPAGTSDHTCTSPTDPSSMS